MAVHRRISRRGRLCANPQQVALQPRCLPLCPLQSSLRAAGVPCSCQSRSRHRPQRRRSFLRHYRKRIATMIMIWFAVLPLATLLRLVAPGRADRSLLADLLTRHGTICLMAAACIVLLNLLLEIFRPGKEFSIALDHLCPRVGRLGDIDGDCARSLVAPPQNLSQIQSKCPPSCFAAGKLPMPGVRCIQALRCQLSATPSSPITGGRVNSSRCERALTNGSYMPRSSLIFSVTCSLER